MPQEYRKRRQRERQEAGLRRQLQKHWKRLLEILGVATILDVVKETARSKIVDWILIHFGHLGRLLIGNPFFLLTVALISICVWVLWVVVKARSISESAVLGSDGEKLYRPQMSTRFIAGTFTVTLLSLSCVAYGAYRYYAVPVPNVVALSRAWFAEGFRHNDLYIALVLKNYSDVPIPVHITTTVYVDNEAMPSDDESPQFQTIPPWQEHTDHLEIGFKKDVPPPDLRWALQHNLITVGLDATYNNGKRDVTFRYLGRLLGDHYVPQLEGQINILKDEID